MKRKLLAMSLSLVIVTSLVLGGCGKEEKEVATSTEAEVESVFEDIKDTEEDTEKVVAEATEEKETEKETESKDSRDSATNTINGSTGSSSGNKSDSTISNSGSSNSGSTSGNSSSSHSGNSSEGTSSSNTETSHVHSWVAVTTTVHHPAETHQEDQGHYDTIIDSEAWDEEVTDADVICLTCYYNSDGKTIVRLHSQEEVNDHIDYHFYLNGGSCQYGNKRFSTGEYIHHDAVTHQEWVSNMVTVVDKEAWDEEVITGYVCSECGATK